MHSHRAPSWKKTCRTVQVLPECLRLSTIPAVHCIVAAKGFSYGIQNKLHSPTEWASWIPSTPKKKLPIHVHKLCCSRAPRAVQQRVPLDRASVTGTTGREDQKQKKNNKRPEKDNNQHTKPHTGACSSTGVLRGFWITQGRIPQCRREEHLNNIGDLVA